MNVKERIEHAWNAFKNTNPVVQQGHASSQPAHRTQKRYGRPSFSGAIFSRIASDVAMTTIQHVKVDPKNGDVKVIQSGINECLNTQANIDQSGMSFIQDIVYSMFDEGVIAVVPIDTSINPHTGSYEIETMRTGKILQWFPKHVRVRVYNEEIGDFEEVVVAKSYTAILENPLYAVINGPNATLTRLLEKMAMLDDLDALLASGRLDIFIQIPGQIKTELQQNMARERLASIDANLAQSRNGIAYIDSTEKIHQLNRPANNQLLESIKILTEQFYNQLGLTQNIFDGTATESQMRTYYSRTVDLIVEVIIREFRRTFLTKTARTQGHTFQASRNMFKLVPIEQVAQLGDTFRRNSILTSNEMRGIVGFPHSDDPKADMLYNPNMPEDKQAATDPISKSEDEEEELGSLTSPDESSSPNQNE